MMIGDGQIVLFQGDSITDAGRSRENPAHLGGGYPAVIAQLFKAAHPAMNVRFINRGISGNRVKDLQARWSADCIELRPDVVSILIGINDTWRRFDSNDETSAEAYYDGYRAILQRVRSETSAAIVMMEPFVLPFPADRRAWRADLDPKIAAMRELAAEFRATLIPLDGIFAAAAVASQCSDWAADGVHPTPAGHALIAKHWLAAVGA